jgi:decaprenylphospho-beta-D-ribofuranose 2-oxidase
VTTTPVLLTGWGRTAASGARLAVPETPGALADLIDVGAAADRRPVLARGLGRSYGDAAQSAGGLVISTEKWDTLELDADRGLLVADAGSSLDDVLRTVVPQGWFVPVTPGTRFVSLGGAIAADVHGKNHHVDGSIGSHLDWLELIDGTGRLQRLSPTEQPGAFWATVGGMGLTGVITRAALRLRRVPSAWMTVETVRAPDLDSLTDLLREHDQRWRYTVAWIDVLSSGRGFGRGVITSGDHADVDALPAGHRDRPLDYGPHVRLAAPPMPLGAVTPLTARAFNEAWFRKAPSRSRVAPQRLEGFFHPLDGVRDWNRLYGPHGFLQYQFVVPQDRVDVVRQALTMLQAARSPAFLAVLKRFGAADPAPLSFPRPGWTLAMDIPAAPGSVLAETLDRLDRLVAEADGAVYLAKDSRLQPELLDVMYPRLDAWRAERDRLDPHRRFGSDLSRRLQL